MTGHSEPGPSHWLPRRNNFRQSRVSVAADYSDSFLIRPVAFSMDIILSKILRSVRGCVRRNSLPRKSPERMLRLAVLFC
ncbi:hypothetical protein MLD38_018178 [Melastoma candidum]|uniref:Uncharacterized protein n=1 Tax=Melastoma candidum TaxID=119954 RepID=A0ACB9QTJ2_9MYRT|nr:hypothetical protein MLD38_018178 [Melastoma candidum]